jgi:phosphotransferase system HPr-like phosphotransfer protein
MESSIVNQQSSIGVSMASAHEEDVVIAFRQAVEEEMQKAMAGEGPRLDIFAEGASTEEALHRLAARHAELEHEVALLRTILLRLVSEPVDNQKS